MKIKQSIPTSKGNLLRDRIVVLQVVEEGRQFVERGNSDGLRLWGHNVRRNGEGMRELRNVVGLQSSAFQLLACCIYR